MIWSRSGLARAGRLALVLAGLTLAGCTPTITAQSLVPKTLAPSTTRHSQSVAIAVSGGRVSDPTGLPTISNQAFTDALTTALTNSELFSAVSASNRADYLLTVQIFSVQQPLFGGTFTVTMEAGWQLQEVATGRKVWEKGISSSHSVGMGEEFFGPSRSARATEGAARENIRLGLEMLSQLTL